MNYYNEHDPAAAQWLRNLITTGLIPAGEVDDRSIEDVRPTDLRGFTQCHFFAGIGGWSHALALAGWPADRPVWTGSCPCQSFSAAGKRAGFADQRHLWPAWFHLISQCRPSIIFGEQVASAVGHGWLDLVQTDLEGKGYAVGSAVLGAHSVGAPHQRQRLWFVAHSYRWQCDGVAIVRGVECDREDAGRAKGGGSVGACGEAGELADALRGSCVEQDGHTTERGRPDDPKHARVGGELGQPAKPDSAGRHAGQPAAETPRHGDTVVTESGSDRHGRPGPHHSGWSAPDWIRCRDGKWRPVEPGTQPLAHGIPGRMVKLRAYGNAICPQVAAAFIEASGVS